MRMFDNGLFQQEWFGELKPVQKLLYIYLLMECDLAGIIEINLRKFKFDLNADFNREDIFTWFGNRVIPVGEGSDIGNATKAIIPDFIPFHYGTRLVNDRRHMLHRSVVKRLKACGITLEFVKSHASKPFEYEDFSDVLGKEEAVQTELKGLEQKPVEDNAKEEKANKRKKAASGIDSPYYQPTLEEVVAYFKEVGTNIDPKEFWSKYDSVGWKDKNGNRIKNWKRCLVTWESFRKRNNGGSASRKTIKPDNWLDAPNSVKEKADSVI